MVQEELMLEPVSVQETAVATMLTGVPKSFLHILS